MILLTITTDRQHPERFDSFACRGNIKDPIRIENMPNIGLVPKMHEVWKQHQDEDILCFVHSDVTCHDQQWAERVRKEFDDPRVAVVGFGGATGIGVPDIYKIRYDITQLQRMGYVSNAADWDTHGGFEEGSRDVAVIDGYFMAIRSAFLKTIGGFSWMPFAFHCYDLALCLMAHRMGWKVRMVGCKAMHWGGGTSTSPEYKKWCEDHGSSLEDEHRKPHEWMYDFFRSELPLRIL